MARSGREAGVDTEAAADVTTVASHQDQDVAMVVLGKRSQRCESLAKYGNLEVQTYKKSHLVIHPGLNSLGLL